MTVQQCLDEGQPFYPTQDWILGKPLLASLALPEGGELVLPTN